MESGCVYEEKTVIHQLTQGLQMAELLRTSLHSPEARDFYIHKILSSYENALVLLQSGHSAGQPPSLPESSVSFGCPGSGENAISKKRKWSTTREDEVKICGDNGRKGIQGDKFPRSYYKCSYRKVQKYFETKQVQRTDENPAVFETAYKRKHTLNHSPSPSPPPSPEKYEITPTHHHHQLSPPTPGEMLSNIRSNPSVNTSVPSSFSFPSTSSVLMEDYDQLHIPDFDDEIFQVCSPPFISPVTSESKNFSEWGSSQSLDLLADVDTDFEFSSLFN